MSLLQVHTAKNPSQTFLHFASTFSFRETGLYSIRTCFLPSLSTLSRPYTRDQVRRHPMCFFCTHFLLDSIQLPKSKPCFLFGSICHFEGLLGTSSLWNRVAATEMNQYFKQVVNRALCSENCHMFSALRKSFPIP